ncbi:MAG: ABC transporter permease subunit [Clostridiaceae bacterium]|nr:ABC transporter permease subunit [Clostridiaceae bacterium]
MKAIFRRELNSYFKGLTGYIFAAFSLLFAGIYTMAINLKGGYANFEYVLSNMAFVFLIIIPILTMRVLAEEKRQKTDQLLYALPLGMGRVVLGKYFAMLPVIAAPLCVMALYPLLLGTFGDVSYLLCYGTLLAFFLLGAALAAIGMFISSLTESQVASAGLCFAAMLLLYFMSDLSGYVSQEGAGSYIALALMILAVGVVLWLLTKNSVFSAGLTLLGEGGLLLGYKLSSDAFAGLFPQFMKALSPFERFSGFVDGTFDLTGVVYFLSVIGVFLFLTVQSMEKRRWS